MSDFCRCISAQSKYSSHSCSSEEDKSNSCCESKQASEKCACPECASSHKMGKQKKNEEYEVEDLCARCQKEVSCCDSKQNFRTNSPAPDSPSTLSHAPKHRLSSNHSAHSNKSCSEKPARHSSSSVAQPRHSSTSRNSPCPIDENCPVHGKQSCKACTSGRPQVRFNKESQLYPTADSSVTREPKCFPDRPQCGGSKRTARTSFGARPGCPLICEKDAAERNLTQSELKFDEAFESICTTLGDEMYRISKSPCVDCCVPSYVTKGKSKTKRTSSVE